MDKVEKVRVLVCGNGGVGKNRLIEQFTSAGERRASTLCTIAQLTTAGVDVQHKTICVGENNIKLQIWTTAGQERFKSLPAKYYGRADAVILVYDVTKTKTFDSVKQWLTDITENTLNRDVRIALVGNKIDLVPSKRADIYSRSRTLASSSGILFFETSAETGENVEELFHALAREVLDKRHTQRQTQSETPSASVEREQVQEESFTLNIESDSRTSSQHWLCRHRC